MTFDIAKAITTGVWALFFFSLVTDFPPAFETTLLVLGLFLIIAHTGECFAFRQQIVEKPEPLPFAYLMTFLYGVLYLRNWPTDPWDGKAS